MKSKSNSYYKIEAHAKLLFWKHGIKKISVEEICTEASVSKMTFYRNFKNKQELAEIVLLNVLEKARKGYERIMSSDLPFVDKLTQAIELDIKNAQDISEELLEDMFKNNKSLVSILEKENKKNIKHLTNEFKKAQDNNEIRKELKPEVIVYFLNNITQIFLDKNFTKLFKTPKDAISELGKYFMFGIIQNDNIKE